MGGYLRFNLSDAIAIENKFSASKELGHTGGYNAWKAVFNSSLLFQVSNTVAVGPTAYVAAMNQLHYLNEDDFYDEDDDDLETDILLPIGLWLGWSPHKQLDLQAEYRYGKFGYPNDSEAHSFFLTINHLW